MKEKIKDMIPARLEARLVNLGAPKYSCKQILKWLYEKQVKSFDEMTDLSKDLRKILTETFEINCIGILNIQTSKDGTEKILFRLSDGLTIEGVIIPDGKRTTLCVSTQAGCAMACRFCQTGAVGFKRNLSCGEIVEQVLEAESIIAPENRLTNLVIMGMGEPLLNFKNLADALLIINTCAGFSHSDITVSTCGITDKIEEFGNLGLARIAVSLNAADDAVRSKIMPVNKKYPLDKLIVAIKNYPRKHREKITIEYVLLDGVNTSPADAKKLCGLLSGITCKINLIPFNAGGTSEFKTPGGEDIKAFRTILEDAGCDVFFRKSRGKDISAACGQLGGQHVGKTQEKHNRPS